MTSEAAQYPCNLIKSLRSIHGCLRLACKHDQQHMWQLQQQQHWQSYSNKQHSLQCLTCLAGTMCVLQMHMFAEQRWKHRIQYCQRPCGVTAGMWPRRHVETFLERMRYLITTRVAESRNLTQEPALGQDASRSEAIKRILNPWQGGCSNHRAQGKVSQSAHPARQCPEDPSMADQRAAKSSMVLGIRERLQHRMIRNVFLSFVMSVLSWQP